MTKARGISTAAQAGAEDYRKSHRERGPSYDETINATPFDAYMARWEARRLAQLVCKFYPARIPRYLDFACGTGRITQTLVPFAEESLGVDISASMLEVARQKCPHARFIEVDLTRETLDLGEFDVITSFRFLGNAQDELRRAALSVISKLLRPGGHLIVNNHRNPMSTSTLLHRLTGGRNSMDLSYFKLCRLLREHGLRPVFTLPIGFWLIRSRAQVRSDICEVGESRERLFRSSLLAPFAPDMIVVATLA